MVRGGGDGVFSFADAKCLLIFFLPVAQLTSTRKRMQDTLTAVPHRGSIPATIDRHGTLSILFREIKLTPLGSSVEQRRIAV